MYKIAITAFLGGWLAAGGALAAVSPEQAAQLGKDLTPTGAEMAGNEDGSIPPWNPKGPPIPANFVPGSDNYTNPYADEQPLFTIDGSNWEQYADHLTEGTKGIFESLGADGFKMHVYPTKRDYVYPDYIVGNTVRNATGATMVADGQKLEGNLPGVPFPIPQSGMEAMWNHMIRYQIDYTADYDVYYVSSDGKPILSTTGHITNTYPIFHGDLRSQPVEDTPWVKLRINYMAPGG